MADGFVVNIGRTGFGREACCCLASLVEGWARASSIASSRTDCSHDDDINASLQAELLPSHSYHPLPQRHRLELLHIAVAVALPLKPY